MFDWKDIRTGILLALILGILGLIWSYTQSLIEDISFKAVWDKILSAEVNIVWFISICILCLVLLLKLPKGNFLNSKQKAIQKFNKIEFENINSDVEFSVYFDDHKRPCVTNLIIFCKNHTPPLRYVNNKYCPDGQCVNNEDHLSPQLVKNQVQSHVDDYWRKLNS